MKKILMIIAPDNFRDEEFFIPKETFESSGAEVTVCSKVTGEIIGTLKGKTVSTLDYKKADPSLFDVTVFVGGSGAQTYLDDPIAHDIARKTLNSKKILGAICIAPLIIAKAGVLNKKNATVYPGGKDALTALGVNYTGDKVTVDGNIVTADGPSSAKLFAEEIIKLW